jgi:peptide/nickel transport system substrate-binding protein
MRRAFVLLAVIVLAATMVPMASAQEDGERVVLRIGDTQNWSSLNPTAGYLFADYEVWNMQYGTLTNKAADDFEVIPGLAESWVASDDGLVYTYTLREGLQWSDGEPLTSEDVVWNITTANEQEWANHLATTINLTAVAIDDRTVEITSSVPDPKLPAMDFYLLPKHIWEPVATDATAVTEYDGLDGVGSGPFVLEEYRDQQSATLVANPSFYGWEGEEPPIDEVILQYFANPDAMVAALIQGELDAINSVPTASVATLEDDPNIEFIVGEQGSFGEIAMNGGAAEGQPHPALLDLTVRQAISHGVDRQAIIDDLWLGLVEPLDAFTPAADARKWTPEIPADQQLRYDPEQARQLLDEAGYLDTDGDGIREMPDGTEPIILDHAINTDGDLAQPIAELFQGWMEEIGIGVEFSSYDADQLFEVIVEGTYDTFYWGWGVFVDPDYMLSYFTESEIGNYNDANWVDPRYEELYQQQKVETDEATRIELVHEMVTVFHDAAVYIVTSPEPELQAYRTDTFEGWVRQPADIGPVIFSQTGPSYPLLRPVGSGGAGGDGVNWILVGGIAAVVVIGGVLIATRRRSTADERE